MQGLGLLKKKMFVTSVHVLNTKLYHFKSKMFIKKINIKRCFRFYLCFTNIYVQIIILQHHEVCYIFTHDQDVYHV